MKLRKILLWILFGLIALNVFNYSKMHTRGDVITYKKFAKALMKSDSYVMRTLADRGITEQVMQVQDERLEPYEDVDVIFTYYRIRDRRISEDGRIATLVGEQISRVNPIGYDTLWGEQKIVVRQVTTLVMQNNAWKLQSFNDAAMD